MTQVVVLGAGAVGSVFGARLAGAGTPVLLVGRPAHVAAIRAGGLLVEGIGPAPIRLDAATEVPRQTHPRAVLVTVKTYDLSPALRDLATSLAPAPTAVLANGLGIERVALASLRDAGWTAAEAWCVRGVHTVPATFVAPGHVRAAGTGEVIFPTPEGAGAAAGVVRTMVELLSTAGFRVRTSPTFELEVWRKAVVNAAVNPVTALRGVPNGALREGPARAQAERLLEEAVAVARKSGIDLDPATAHDDLERVLRATARNRSSMLQDMDRGRPTEIDTISGEVLRRGRALGLALPATSRAIEDLRRALAERQRPAQP